MDFHCHTEEIWTLMSSLRPVSTIPNYLWMTGPCCCLLTCLQNSLLKTELSFLIIKIRCFLEFCGMYELCAVEVWWVCRSDMDVRSSSVALYLIFWERTWNNWFCVDWLGQGSGTVSPALGSRVGAAASCFSHEYWESERRSPCLCAQHSFPCPHVLCTSCHLFWVPCFVSPLEAYTANCCHVPLPSILWPVPKKISFALSPVTCIKLPILEMMTKSPSFHLPCL